MGRSRQSGSMSSTFPSSTTSVPSSSHSPTPSSTRTPERGSPAGLRLSRPSRTRTTSTARVAFCPPTRWSCAATVAALNRLKDYEGSRFDGVILRYADPEDGSPTTDTMDFTVQQLRPGQRTESHRHTSSTAYCCLEGAGRTEVGDAVLEWGRNDTFVVPSWTWHRHMNASVDDVAILYGVTDAPVAKGLGLYREEARGEHV